MRFVSLQKKNKKLNFYTPPVTKFQKFVHFFKYLPINIIAATCFFLTLPIELYKYRAEFIQIFFTRKVENNAKIAEKYSKRRYWAWRAIAASAEVTPISALLKLAYDENEEVVNQVSWNSKDKPEVIEAIKNRLKNKEFSPGYQEAITYSFEQTNPDDLK